MSQRRGTVPGPVRRLLRDRSRSAAIILLGIVALATSGIQAGAAQALRATLDENWRGSYDILVVPADAEQSIDGMLPPNSLASTEEGMTFADLAAVREIGGVGVAAPIGEIAAPGLKFVNPRVAIPRDAVDASQQGQAFRVRVEFSTDDGLGERVIGTEARDIVIDGSSATRPAAECEPVDSGTYDRYDYTAEEYPALAASTCFLGLTTDGVYTPMGDGGWMFEDSEADDPYSFRLPDAPQSTTRITLVDPAAEQALLGESGAFLDPLVALAPGGETDDDQMISWARAAAEPYGQDFLDDQAQVAALNSFSQSDAVLADLRRLWAANGDDYDAYIGDMQGEQRFVPILVSDAPAADLGVRVTVESFGAVERLADDAGFPFALPEALTAGGPGEAVGTTAADISEALNPFSEGTGSIAWPGTDLAATAGLREFNTLAFQAIGRVIGGKYASADDAISLGAAGYRDPRDSFSASGEPNYFDLDADATKPGVETAYSGISSAGVPSSIPISAVPIGSFSGEGITAADTAVDYVPLGAYEPVGTTVTGGERDGAVLQPSVSGLGLVSPRTVAIGSIQSAAAWGQEAPINAIRVRVAGIDAYSPQAQERVVSVAAAIEGLGLRAIVVAGSSPSEVAVAVDDYAFGTTSADGAQTVGPLGSVSQRWSELGAASRAELAISTASLTVLGIALASTVVLLGAVQIAGLPRRRQQSAVMRELGFTRSRVARWIASEEAPAVIVTALVAGLALWLSGISVLTTGVAAGVIGTVLLTSAVAVAIGSRPTTRRLQRRGASGRIGARSIRGFGMRQAGVHAFTSLTHLIATAIVGLSAAALVSVLLRGRQQAGQSLLASFIADQQLVPQLALGSAGVAAGVLMALLGRRMDLARRAAQWSTMRAAGWTARELARAQRAEGLVVIIPALILAAALAWFGATLLALTQPLLLTVISVAGGAATAAIAFSISTKGTAR